MSHTDWTRTDQVSHSPLPTHWTFHTFHKQNMRFIQDFIPGEDNDDLRTVMLLGYGKGFEKIQEERHMLPTSDTLYLKTAYDAVAKEVAVIPKTDDTEKAYEVGFSHAYWHYQEHKNHISQSYKDVDEREENLNSILYDEEKNYYDLRNDMRRAHTAHRAKTATP